MTPIIFIMHTNIFCEPITPLHLKKGEQIRIELDSNPSTGYSWHLSNQSELNKVIAIVKKGFDEKKSHLIGSPSKQFWDIKGKKPGLAYLVLEYKRQWEDKKPEKTKAYVITIE